MKVIGANKLLISHNEMVKTVENVKMNSAICLTTFDKDWKGVRMYGQAKYYATGKWYDLAKELFTTKQTTPKGAIVVTVNIMQKHS